MKKVFLSHASINKKHPLFKRLVRDLDSHPGVAVWLDTAEIRPGDNIVERVDDAISKSDFVVQVFSVNAGDSRWVRQEFMLAYSRQLREQDLRFVPVLIDRNVELPSFMRRSPAVDLSRGYAKGFQKLLTLIQPEPEESLAKFSLDQSVDGGSIISIADTVSERLIDHFRRHPEELVRVDRRKFEELVAELFDGFGYEVELTKQTRDGGRDVIAVSHHVVEVKYLIECKRPDPGGYVGVRPVRELLGVKTDEKATKAILATTAHFSPDALLFFHRHRWELEPRDLKGLLEWIEEYVSLKRKASVARGGRRTLA